MQRQFFFLALVLLSWCIMYRVVGFSVLWLFSLAFVAFLLMKKSSQCFNNLLVIWWSSWLEYKIPWIFDMKKQFSTRKNLKFIFLFWQCLHFVMSILAKVKWKYHEFLNWVFFSRVPWKSFRFLILIHESWLLWEEKECVIKVIQWKGKRHKTFTDSNELSCVKFVQAKIRKKKQKRIKV